MPRHATTPDAQAPGPPPPAPTPSDGDWLLRLWTSMKAQGCDVSDGDRHRGASSGSRLRRGGALSVVWLERGLSVTAVAGLAVLLWTIWDHEAVMAWIGHAGPLPFFAAMVVLPGLGAPLAPFFVVAGATFGVTVGLVGSVLALPLNLVVCYWLARSKLRPHIEKLLRRFDFEIPDFERSGKSAVRFTLLVRLAPGIPVFIKHYGLGVARVPFALYLGSAMLISGGYGLLLVLLGESLTNRDLGGLPAVAGIVVALGGGLLWWRRRHERDVTAAAAAVAPVRPGLVGVADDAEALVEART